MKPETTTTIEAKQTKPGMELFLWSQQSTRLQFFKGKVDMFVQAVLLEYKALHNTGLA